MENSLPQKIIVTKKNPTLPLPFARALALLPAYPGSLLFVTAINLALAKKLPQHVQQSLSGKKLRICIHDAQLTFDFEWRHGKFSACRFTGEPDLMISASAYDFLTMAQRREDPDTLFFSRRLVMEGDTELGLLMKNTMDAADPMLPEWTWKVPANALAQMKAILK